MFNLNIIVVIATAIVLICLWILWNDNRHLEEQLSKKKQEVINKTSYYEDELAKQRNFYTNFLASHKDSMPWLAGMMADFKLSVLNQESQKLRDDNRNVNINYTYTRFGNFSSKTTKKNEHKLDKLDLLIDEAKEAITESKYATYQLKYLTALYPEFEKVLKTDYNDLSLTGLLDYDKIKKAREKQLEEFFASHKDSMPWLAGMMADYLTYDIEAIAQKLDWGENKERAKKVASIREIKAEACRRIEEAKLATYQLEYLKNIYPAIEDVLEVEYHELELTGEMPDCDPVRKYLEKDEWEKLSVTEKNQLALDRYIESRKKSKWQIGRDYELSVAWEYQKAGYEVDTHGSYMGLEDMGRDIIVKKDGHITIIQCKYWGKEKLIHEKHIFQLFGSIVSYCTEENCDDNSISGVLVTNIEVSETARKVAKYLKIEIDEHHKMVEFPRIKCNLGHSEFGDEKIYHLPMDEQYDSTKIDKPGEFYAFTVQEAEDAGFRRAYKHIFK